MATPQECGPRHPAYKHFLDLKNNKTPNPDRLVTLEGHWEVGLAEKHRLAVTELFVCPQLLTTPENLALAERLSARATFVFTVAAKAFERLSDRDRPDGIAATAMFPVRAPDWLEALAPQRLAILDGLEIPGNAGTILRSADGAGLDAVLIVNRKFRLVHPKVVSASQGACFSVPIVELERPACIAWLARRGVRVLLGDSKAEHDYLAADCRAPCALVVGGEKQGVHTDWYATAHTRLKIPMRGTCDSLNVACAATLLMYQLGRDAR